MVAERISRTKWYGQNGMDRIMNYSSNPAPTDNMFFALIPLPFGQNLALLLFVSCGYSIYIQFNSIEIYRNYYHFVRTIFSVPFFRTILSNAILSGHRNGLKRPS